MNFKVIKSKTVFEGKVFKVVVDEIKYNGSGNIAPRQVAVHPGGAVTVPVKSYGKIVMVTQFRYPFKEVLLELPAGKLNKNEDPEICAARELSEETGYSANKITRLGKIYTSPGFCSEVLHIFLAEDLVSGQHAREEGEEEMEVVELSLEEINEKIKNGEIVDAKTICGISLYKLHTRH
ncbi:NUDIX hydrolase [Melioribacteraceae bacterium 4301-Me]|uniref:NUDIX hydrolase n=1 Tax=Pyranulibacter aquaticus TaxID=3163344 RepID=UPI003599697D